METSLYYIHQGFQGSPGTPGAQGLSGQKGEKGTVSLPGRPGIPGLKGNLCGSKVTTSTFAPYGQIIQDSCSR